MTIHVIVAAATGWAGSELARGMAAATDLQLVAAVSRTHAGRPLGEVLGEPRLTSPVYATAMDAPAHPCEVFVEYTRPRTAKGNVLAALRHGAHVVIGIGISIDLPGVGGARARARRGRRDAGRGGRSAPRGVGTVGVGAPAVCAAPAAGHARLTPDHRARPGSRAPGAMGGSARQPGPRS